MKKLILFLLFAGVYLSISGQPGYLKISSTKYAWELPGRFVNGLHLPTGCGNPTLNVAFNQWPGSGAIYMDTCNNKMYWYRGGAWYRIADTTFAGGGGTNNANIGAGFRLLKPGDQTVKTVYAGEGQEIDSTTNTDGLTFKTIDTINAVGVKSVTELLSTNYHLINATYKRKNSTDKPIIKLLGWRNPGDGGGGNFYYDDTSTAAVDSGMVFRPSSVPVGQSGRWKRILETPEVNVLWFGAIRHDSRVIGDIVDTAINSQAFQRAMNALPLLDVGGTVQKAGHKILVPRGTYWLDTTWVIDRAAWIIGDAGSQTTVGARLIFPNGTSGLHVYPADPIIVPARTGGACTIQGIWADSYFSNRYSSDTLGHGFKIKSTSTLRDCKASNFAGNGFDFNSDGGMIGTDSFGNNGLTLVEKCRAEGNKNGFYTHGGDANIIHFTDCDATANLGWGYWEDAFLGNLYVNCHAADNTYATGNKSQVFHGGKQYIALAYSKGIEPGVTSGWENYFVDVGAPFSTYFQDWHADTLYRGGGSYNSWPGQNGQNMYLSCYAEGGQPAMFGPRTMVLGGVTNAMIFPTGVAANRDMSMVASNGAYYWNAPIRWQKATYPLRWEMGFDGMKFSPMEGWPYDAYSYRFNYDSTIRKFQSYYESPISYSTYNISTHGTSPTDYGLSANNPGMIEFPRGINLGKQVTGGYRRFAFGTAPPNSGEWATGDFVLNAVTGTGDTTLGWRCTSGGSQGTWEIVRIGGAVSGGGSSGVSVDTIYRTPGKDSIQFLIDGRYYAILDSTGGGAGSGTVNTGSQYELAFYPNTGTTVDGNTGITTSADNGLYVSSAEGQPFSISSTSSTGFSGSGFYRPAKFMTPNMTAGQTSQIFFGKAENSNDAMSLDFLWNGTSNTSNRIDFGFYGQSIMKLWASGNVGISAISDIGQKLYVNGNAHVGNTMSATKLYAGGLSGGSAHLHIGPGTTATSTGPLKFTPVGARLLNVPEIGVLEVWQDSIYYTDSSGIRHRLEYASSTSTIFENISNTSLTASNDFTQNWAGYRLRIHNIDNIDITSDTVGGRYTTLMDTKPFYTGLGITSVYDANNQASFQVANGNGTSGFYMDAQTTGKYTVVSGYADSITLKSGTGIFRVDSVKKATSETDKRFLVHDTATKRLEARELIISSGIYTPDTSGTNNIDAFTMGPSMWTRTDSIVTVTGSANISTNTQGIDTGFEITIPIASNFTTSNDAMGVITSHKIYGIVQAAAPTDKIFISFDSSGGLTEPGEVRWTFQYRIK